MVAGMFDVSGWEWSGWDGWWNEPGGVPAGWAWVVTGCLALAGVAGTFLPVLPGHLLIFLAAVAHRWMRGTDSGVEWWTFVALLALLALSAGLEFLSGAAGARWFGGSRWGAFGAVCGGIAGLFFMPLGLVLGPLAGAFLMEWLVKRKKVREATVSGIGSALGAATGLAVKVALAFVMAAYLVADILWI